MFEVARITYIYWPIECTTKPSFVMVLEVARITYKSIGELNAFKKP
jgi:hypothetical protein